MFDKHVHLIYGMKANGSNRTVKRGPGYCAYNAGTEDLVQSSL